MLGEGQSHATDPCAMHKYIYIYLYNVYIYRFAVESGETT